MLLVATATTSAQAYIEVAYTLGRVIQESTSISLVRVEKVERERNLIVFRKVQDLRGTLPTETLKHNIGRGGFHEREWKAIMDWAEPGRTAVFFNNGSASETCINNYWYQAYNGGEWWNMSHGEPYMLRSYAGSPDKLAAIVTSMLAGQEVVVPCMIDGDKNALQLRAARIQRLKASIKIQDYNAARDFVGWGGDDFRPILGMPGFTHLAGLTRVDPEARSIAVADFDGDQRPDFCVVGMGRVALFRMDGASLTEVVMPPVGGARDASWSDFNGDNKPDLLVATPRGPRLLTNLGGSFRDDSSGLPVESYYNVTAAAWIDYDGDQRPDILMANGFLGLRLYRNVGPGQPKLFADVSESVGLGSAGIGGQVKGDQVLVADVNGDGRSDFLYSAGTGILALNAPQGFVEVKDSGIQYPSGGVRPLLQDLNGDKLPDLFVPLSTGCKLFANRGGKFVDVTSTAGELGRPLGQAVSATAVDWTGDGDGRPDIFVACLKGPNRFFRASPNGTYTEATAELGLDLQRLNSRSLAAVDINRDGTPDLIANNEGQESIVLLAKPVVGRAVGGAQ